MKPELLAPAGDMEKLKYALAYGADAVYIGGRAYGLRAYAGNFEREEISEAVQYTHRAGSKIYVAVNIFAHEQDLAGLSLYLKELESLGVDGAIVSDPGVIDMARETAPCLPLHLSTQANTTNSSSANFWFKQGLERIVLARELTLEDLKLVKSKTSGELEIFVHGAMCMSYSGRCLISNYLTGRDANRGECTQPCRWEFGIAEKKRPGQIFSLEEDERGTYVFNSHDLCLLPYLPLLKPIQIESWKIEGRMKSVHYVASTVKVYRQAIDILWNEGEEAFRTYLPQWYAELDKVSHRDYSPGFLFGKPGHQSHNLNTSHYVRDYDFVGLASMESGRLVCSCPEEAGYWVEQRNHFQRGERLEVFSPQEDPWSFTVAGMWTGDGETMEVARHAKQLIRMELPRPLSPFSILRRDKKDKLP